MLLMGGKKYLHLEGEDGLCFGCLGRGRGGKGKGMEGEGEKKDLNATALYSILDMGKISKAFRF